MDSKIRLRGQFGSLAATSFHSDTVFYLVLDRFRFCVFWSFPLCYTFVVLTTKTRNHDVSLTTPRSFRYLLSVGSINGNS